MPAGAVGRSSSATPSSSAPSTFPKWNTISISGYHIREAGSTAVQELAFTLRDGIEYVEDVIRRKRLDVDDFAPRLSFFFNAHIDFFEEICKMRAARRIWAKVMRDRFKAKNPRSWWMRFHTQTAGCSLTAQQPYNNVVRTAIEALAAVLGGTQSLHTNSLDEVLCLPSDHAVEIALRTQQIIAEETGVGQHDRPAGRLLLRRVPHQRDGRAGLGIHREDRRRWAAWSPPSRRVSPSWRSPTRPTSSSSQIDAREKIMVGVNKYVTEKEGSPSSRSTTSRRGADRAAAAVKRKRDSKRREAGPRRLKTACKRAKNVMPFCIEAVKDLASVQEICDVYREVYGEYRDPGLLLRD